MTNQLISRPHALVFDGGLRSDPERRTHVVMCDAGLSGLDTSMLPPVEGGGVQPPPLAGSTSSGAGPRRETVPMTLLPKDVLEVSEAVPARYLGGGPEPWEQARGGILSRLCENGHISSHIAKLVGQEEKVDEVTVSRVKELGKSAIQIIPLRKAQPVLKERAEENRRRATAFIVRGDPAAQPTPPRIFDRSSSLRMETDWHTETFSKHEIIAACTQLLDEACATSNLEHRGVALRMLKILIDRHRHAYDFMSRELEAMVRSGLPHYAWAISPATFQVAWIFEAMAPVMPVELTRYNIIDRILRMLLRESELAARLVQHRMRAFLTKRQIRDQPWDVRVRYMAGINSVSSDLNRQWRGMHAPGSCSGAVPVHTVACYLRTLLVLVGKGSSRYFRVNRRRVCEQGGLMVLRMAMMSEDSEVQEAADLVMAELSKEPTLLRSILSARLAEQTADQLVTACYGCPSGDNPRAVRALDILSGLASGSHTYFHRIQTGGSKMKELLRFADLKLEDDGSLPDVDIPTDELAATAERVMPSLIERTLNTEDMIETIVCTVETQQSRAILVGGVRVLEKLASTFGQQRVLERLTTEGSTSLDRILRALEGSEPSSAVAVTALFMQLAATQHGRDTLCGRGAAVLVRRFCAAERAYDTWPSLSALRCLAALGRTKDPVFHDPDAVDLSASLVAMRSMLYDELYVLMTDGGAEAAARSTATLRRISASRILVSFLVRLGDAPIKYPHRAQAAVVLDGLLRDRSVMRSLLEGSPKRVLDYLQYVIKVDTATMLDQREAYDALRYQALISACTALGRIVISRGEVVRGMAWETESRYRLMGSLRDVVETHGARCKCHPRELVTGLTLAVLQLLIALAPTPEYETLPYAQTEPRVDYEAAELAATPHLSKMCDVFVPCLLELARAWVDRPRVAGAACGVLAKFATTYDTCTRLVAEGALTMIEHACDRVLLRAKRCENNSGVCSVEHPHFPPPTHFELLANLARIMELRARMLDARLLRMGLMCMAWLSSWTKIENGKPQLPLALRVQYQTHVLLFISRMAHTFTPEMGQADDCILADRHTVIHDILAALQDTSSTMSLKYSACTAAASLLRDTLKAVPPFVAAGITPILITQIQLGSSTPHPLVRRVLECLKLIATHPSPFYLAELEKVDIRGALYVLANSPQLAVAFKSRMALADLAGEILTILDRSSRRELRQEDADAAMAPASAPCSHAEKKTVHPTKRLKAERRPVSCLPVHRLAVAKGTAVEYGPTTCGALRPNTGEAGLPNRADNPSVAFDCRRREAMVQKGPEGQVWRQRWKTLACAPLTDGHSLQPSPADTESHPSEVALDMLRKSRPPVRGKEHGVDSRRQNETPVMEAVGPQCSALPSVKSQGRTDEEQYAKLLMLDYLFDPDHLVLPVGYGCVEAAQAVTPGAQETQVH